MTTAKKERFIQLRAEGNPYRQIADELKVSKQTLVNWSKDLEVELANRRQIELDSLRASYQATKEARLKTLGSILQRISTELQTRSLSDLPTDKLIDLSLKIFACLDKEAVPTTCRERSVFYPRSRKTPSPASVTRGTRAGRGYKASGQAISDTLIAC